jgi:hypothetical protein
MLILMGLMSRPSFKTTHTKKPVSFRIFPATVLEALFSN